jgi:cytochrome bd-type quinol oxidase subunit 2
MTDAAPSRRRWELAGSSLATAQFGACLLLILQFLLGMVTNLFVTIPAHHPGANANNYFAGVAEGIGWVIPHGQFWLTLHAGLGLLLIVAAFVVAARASRAGGRAAAITSGIAALAVLGAGFNGASFLNYGQNVSSMIMAALWSLALGSYLTGLYLNQGHHDTVTAQKP